MGISRTVLTLVAALALLTGGVPARADDRPDTPVALSGGKVINKHQVTRISYNKLFLQSFFIIILQIGRDYPVQ